MAIVLRDGPPLDAFHRLRVYSVASIETSLVDTIIFVVIVVSVAMAWWSVVDVLKRRDSEWPHTGLSRLSWAAIVWFIPLGGVAYLVVDPPAKLGPRDRRAEVGDRHEGSTPPR